MHTSVIVIHDTNDRYDYESVRAWFAASSMSACEATDIFDAIDKMSDFTKPGCPDVFLVSVHPGSPQDKMICQFETVLDGTEVPLAVVSDVRSREETRSFNFGSVGLLKADLDRPFGRSRATVG